MTDLSIGTTEKMTLMMTCEHEHRFKRWLSPDKIGWYCDDCKEFLNSQQRCLAVTKRGTRCLVGVVPDYGACTVHNPDPDSPWKRAISTPEYRQKRREGRLKWRANKRRQDANQA